MIGSSSSYLSCLFLKNKFLCPLGHYIHFKIDVCMYVHMSVRVCVHAHACACMLLIVRDGGFLRACYNLLFSYSSLGSHIHHRDVTLLESKELGNSNTQLLKGKSPGHSESVTFTAPEQRGKVVLESIHCPWRNIAL